MLEVTWEKGLPEGWQKGAPEDLIVVKHTSRSRWGTNVVGPFKIPARLFHDISRAGVALLKEHNYGTFFEAKEISLAVKKAPRPEDDGEFIVEVFVCDNFVFQFWCDRISKWGTDFYTFEMKGQNIAGIGASRVNFAKELDGFDWQVAMK